MFNITPASIFTPAVGAQGESLVVAWETAAPTAERMVIRQADDHVEAQRWAESMQRQAVAANNCFLYQCMALHFDSPFDEQRREVACKTYMEMVEGTSGSWRIARELGSEMHRALGGHGGDHRMAEIAHGRRFPTEG